MTSAATPARPAIPVGLVLLLGSLTAFAPLSIDMYLPSLPAIARDLGADAAGAELTVAAFFVGLAIGQLFYGPLSDRIGRRPPLLIGVALFVAATIACAFAQTIEALVALRFVQALGGCAGIVIARAVVADCFPRHEAARVFSLLILVMGVAPILAPLAGGAILATVGWRAIFWVLAGFGALVGIAAGARLEESRPDHVAVRAREESPLGSFAAVIGNGRIMGYALGGSFAGAGLFTYIAASPDLIIETFGVPPQHFGWIFGANAIGFIVASQLNRALLARYRLDTVLAGASAVTLIAAVVLLAAAMTGVGGPAGVLVPLFVVLACLGFTMPNATAGAMTVDPQRAGATSAVLGCLQFACGATGAIVAGAFHDGSALPMAAVIASSLAISAVALWLARGRRLLPHAIQ